MKRRKLLPQYIAGLASMALGVVLIKKADIGISPLSAIPAALSDLTPFSLGKMTMIFHVLCVVVQIVLIKKVTLKSVLTVPLAVVFGYTVDFFMFLFAFQPVRFWMKLVLCLGGTLFTGIGIASIVGVGLMLPAPDSLLHTVSSVWNKPLSSVKTAGDIVWVSITVLIELAAKGHVSSIGVGTLISMLLTGELVGYFRKKLPFLSILPAENQQSS